MNRYRYLLNKITDRIYLDAILPLKPAQEGLTSINYRGIQHPIYLRKNTSDIPTFSDVFYTGQYNIDIGFEPETIIDCGANIGLSSIYFKNRFHGAKIIAIEPETSNFELLAKNTELYNDIHCLRSGIWNKDTHLEITNVNTADKWGFMTEEKEVAGPNTIPAVSIDSILAKYDIDTIDILKVDIEGSEKELFEQNHEHWLPKVRVLIIELHDNMRTGCAQSTFKALSGYEFSLSQRGENLIFKFGRDR